VNAKLLFSGIPMILFGIINIFWYWPTSLGFTLDNHPFPSQHLAEVIEERSGHSLIIRYFPIEAAIEDPYWLFWSLTLYAGIVLTAILVCFYIVKKKSR
jgi:hypothetical protein